MRLNHKIKNALMVLAIPMVITACTSGVSQPENMVMDANQTTANATLVGLPAQDLDKGDCAIFLWEDSRERPLVFFQKAQSSDALIYSNGETIVVRRSMADDQAMPGLYARQQFKLDQQTITVRLTIDDNRNVIEGVRIPAGVINHAMTNGEAIVRSVSGLFGCRL